MAKVQWDAAFAFAAGAEGVYDATLDAITSTLQGDVDNTDDGLLLGHRESGEGQSGMSVTIGRKNEPKAPIGASFTKNLSDFLALEANTLSIGVVMTGSKRTTTATPEDGDFEPSVGFGGLLECGGLAGALDGVGVGWKYVPGGIKTASGLIYYFGNRFELKDILASSLTFTYTPGGLAILEAALEVGSIKDPTSAPTTVALPTLTYGVQASVSSPQVNSLATTWKNELGFNSCVITVANPIETIGDSNADTGEVKEIGDQEITVEATMFVDDNSNDETLATAQMLATAIGTLQTFEFQHGTPETTGSLPAVAHKWEIPDLEITEASPVRLGKKAGIAIKGIARGETENSEAALYFN